MHAPDLQLLTSDQPAPFYQGVATVIGHAEDEWLLDDGHERFMAKRAFGCLVEPMIADRVLVAGSEPRFVISVLEREANAARVSLPGDVELRAGGSLHVHAADSLALAGERSVALRGEELQVRARSGRLLIDRLATVLGTLSAHVDKTTLLGKALELLVDRVTQHSKHSVRTISELEIVQAGTLDHRAEQTMHLHAKQAVVHAEQLVKVDGGQIHLG